MEPKKKKVEEKTKNINDNKNNETDKKKVEEIYKNISNNNAKDNDEEKIKGNITKKESKKEHKKENIINIFQYINSLLKMN